MQVHEGRECVKEHVTLHILPDKAEADHREPADQVGKREVFFGGKFSIHQ